MKQQNCFGKLISKKEKCQMIIISKSIRNYDKAKKLSSNHNSFYCIN